MHIRIPFLLVTKLLLKWQVTVSSGFYIFKDSGSDTDLRTIYSSSQLEKGGKIYPYTPKKEKRQNDQLSLCGLELETIQTFLL